MFLTKPSFLARTLLCLSLASTAASRHAFAQGPVQPEPNMEAAQQWWPALTDYWTPVGWKHHRFRFNIFFDGTIFANPSLSQTAGAWRGQGVQIRVLPQPADNPKAYETMRKTRYSLEDDLQNDQGWTSNAAPVLWTEWSRDGMLLRQHIFAHTPGGQDVETGTEPLFGWVRLSVHDTAPGLPTPQRYTFCLQLNAPHVRPSMFVRNNIRMAHQAATYPRTLIANAGEYNRTTGLHIVEPDGKVRLAIAPGADVEAQFLEGDKDGKDPLLCITLTAQRGQFVDVLVPMIPTEQAVVDEELALGYDKALAEADRFWSPRPQTAATIDVPEPFINDTIHQFERFVEMISERDAATGRNITLSGSLPYVKIWATPTGKLVSMFLDPLGYHDLAEEYLEPFILAQGTRKPPSPHLDTHPGFLGSPERFKSIDWMADHGSLLFAIANHALLSTDYHKKQRLADVAIKACEFIRDARRVTGHGGVEGILPPAKYSDRPHLTQGVWSDGWNYKGLTTSVRLLRQIKHPRAEEFAAEADDYKKTFLAALRKAAQSAPTWTDAQGNTHPIVPTSLHGFAAETLLHGFYLDTGPLMLVFAGLLSADDPIMVSTLKWFREGPPQRYARFGSHFTQLAFLRHEMSSSIPGYSWNIFHNHQLGDRQRFLEGMYSQYAGAITRETRIVCETRGGITGRITHADTPFYMTRLAVVDDLLTEGDLHLLRLCPLAWLKTDKETKFERMPTEFGPVTLRWQLSTDAKVLRVTYANEFHTAPRKILLHVPPVEGLTTIEVNGKAFSVRPGDKLAL